MKIWITTVSVFFVIFGDHAHLLFPERLDYFNMILFRNINIFLVFLCAFIHCKSTNTNMRSILAVGIVFSSMSVVFFGLWWAFNINSMLVYPFSFFGCLALLFFNTLKNYNHTSDPIQKDMVYICLWRPKNAQTILPSLIGSAIGSVCIYAGDHLYGFKWGDVWFRKRKKSHRVIEREFIVIDTGKEFSKSVEKELNKLICCHAGIFKIKLLRFKCVYATRNVLKAIGKDFSPSFFEFIPALYAAKILRWRDERRCKTR